MRCFGENAALYDRIVTALNVMQPEFVGFDSSGTQRRICVPIARRPSTWESSQVSLLQIAHCFAPSAIPHSLLSSNKILKLKRNHVLNVRGWIEINRDFRQSVDEKEQLALYDAADIQFNGFVSLLNLRCARWCCAFRAV